MLRPPPEPVGVNPTNDDLIYVCPLPGCTDTHGHLQISVDRGIWYCYHCGQGGSTLSLRRMTGIAWPCERQAPRDQTALDAVLAAAFGQPLGPVVPAREKVDYVALSSVELELEDKATTRGGLGRAPWLLSLCSLAPYYWQRGCAVPPAPWNVVARAAQYLADRGFTTDDAARWRLHVVCDPELQRRTMYGRVVFPNWDPSTYLLRGFQARTIERGVRPKYLSPLVAPVGSALMLSPGALPAARTRVWRKPILVEGPADAAALDRHGYPAAALCGKGAGDNIAGELALYGADEVTILLDSSEYTAAHAVASHLGRNGLRTKVVHLTSGDPGDATAEEITDALKSAQDPQLTDYLRGLRKNS